jgi:hypothetical protein
MERRSIGTTDQILSRIRGEYLEMPGLRLTSAQAERLWGLDGQTCLAVLESLVEAKFLSRSREGTYGRPAYAMTAAPPLRMRQPAMSARAERLRGLQPVLREGVG